MIRLVVFIGLGVYLVVLVGTTYMAYWLARSKSLPRKKRWLWATGGFLVLFLPVFWDWIPTLAMHQYYCHKEAGFWVYKTAEQWKAENPGVMEGLVANKGAPSARRGDMVNFTDTYSLNQRINWVIDKSGPFLVNQWRWEESILDRSTKEVLVRYVDFSTGNGFIGGEPEIRFWLHSDGCVGGNAANHAEVYEIRRQFSGQEN